jgi:hypothetical protein
MSKEIVKNYGKSIRSKLLNIAKDENVYYQTVLTRYFLPWGTAQHSGINGHNRAGSDNGHWFW